MDNKYLISGHGRLVDSVIDFFTAKAVNPELYNQIFQSCLERASYSGVPNHQTWLKIGLLSLMDYITAPKNLTYLPEGGVPVTIVDKILDLMCDKLLLFEARIFYAPRDRVFKLNEDLIRFFAERGLIKNLLFGFSYIAERYRGSVLKIVVTLPSEKQGIGTGFLFNFQKGTRRYSLVVTNQHVVEHARGLKVLDVADNEFTYTSITSCSKRDIGFILLNEFLDRPSFHLNESPQVLEDIITVGYPPVAMTRDSYQLAHKGEINSLVEDYLGRKLFLFSAKTSPGNSGGPVIDKTGMVVGMVTQDMFHKGAYDVEGQLPYYAAIPAESIRNFFNDEFQVVADKLED